MAENVDSTGTFVFARPEWLDETGSTNDCIRERLALGAAPPGTVVAARVQTRGRGRMGNAWRQAPGVDLAFSFLWEGRAELERAGTLPMACALGVADLLASPGLGIAALCKWPNDVMAGGGKICGILAESGGAGEPRLRLVVGMGLNIAADSGRDAAAGQPVASVEGLIGRRPAPEALLERLLPLLAARLTAWGRGGFAALREDFAARMWGMGQNACVRRGRERLAGTIRGVGEQGELLLEGRDGIVMAVDGAASLDFDAGQLSARDIP